MFERYTEKARRTVFFARYEAAQFGSRQIESEHFLLGLLRENKELACRLFRPNASWATARQQIENHTVLKDKVSTSVDLPLSEACIRILSYANEEADRVSDQFIGTEHLLLGILREETCFAATLFMKEAYSSQIVRTGIEGQARE